MNRLLSIKKFNASMKRLPFQLAVDLLDIEEDGLMVGVSGVLGLGFRLTGIDCFLLDDERKENLIRDMRKLFNQLPENMALSFVIRKENGSMDAEAMQQKAVNFAFKQAEPIVRSRVFAAESQRNVKKEVFLFLLFLQTQSKEEEGLRPLCLRREAALRSTAETIAGQLASCGVKVEHLSRSELIRFYFEKLNPSFSKSVRYEDIFKEDSIDRKLFETLRSRVLLHPPEVSEKSVCLDGQYHSITNLRSLPEETSFGMMAAFDDGLPLGSEWVLTISKPDQERERQRMRVAANLARANAYFRLMEDPLAQERSRQFERFLVEMAERGDQAFEVSLSVLVREHEPKPLQELERTALQAFPKMNGAVGIANHFEHDILFLSHLPLQAAQNPSRFPMLTSALTYLLPIHSEWTGTGEGGTLLKTHGDQVLSLNLFDSSLPASHALMMGSTGSGKSFTANYLLSDFLLKDEKNHVVVIDVGGSYRKLACIFGGSYLEIECHESYAINPFPTKDQFFKEKGKFDPEWLAFLTTLIQKMVQGVGSFSSSDTRILEKAILKTYQWVESSKAPLLGDLEKILKDYSLGDDEDRKRAYQFSKNLSVFTEGRFGSILNRPGSLSLDNRFIVFDLRKLAAHPELQSVLFFVIRSAISRKLDDRNLRKIIAIDEGWRFFNDDVGSKLIDELYRTARKSNALVLTISQSPEDFLESKARTAVLANSYVRYFLKLTKSHELLSGFGLNPNEIEACRNLEMKKGVYSELFIKFLNESVVAKLEPSALDYWMSTTDPEDLIEEERLALKKPGHSELERLNLLAETYPCGRGKGASVQHA